ncbi:MAG: hypothetical protein V1492_01685 [Candidatus Micrarchaeota archaeon]
MLPLKLLLVLVAILGLLLPQFGIIGKDLLTPCLAISVFFSLLATKQQFKLEMEPIKTGFIYNYLVLTVVLVAFAFFLPTGIKEGVILYAIFPPAIGLIVLSHDWGGNARGVFIFQLVSYAASIVFIPLASLLLLGTAVDAMALTKYLIFVFGLPAALSFFFNFKNKELMSDISNVSLAAMFYIAIAVAQANILASASTLLVYSAVFFVLSLAVSYLVARYTKDPDAVLYSFMKNGGAAAGIATALALPAAATLIISAKIFMDIILIVILAAVVEKLRPKPS